MATTPCDLWTGRINASGYGTWGQKLAHRLLWERANGPIPDGLEIDHLCSVRHCVAVDHMELVTRAENNRRAGERKTRCKRGHEKTPDNTYIQPSGARECKVCRREKDRERNKRGDRHAARVSQPVRPEQAPTG